MTTTHELKSWPDSFEAVRDGRKSFEVRLDDRGYDVDDILLLREWDPEIEQYTGREIRAQVRYIYRGQGHDPVWLRALPRDGVSRQVQPHVAVMGISSGDSYMRDPKAEQVAAEATA